MSRLPLMCIGDPLDRHTRRGKRKSRLIPDRGVVASDLVIFGDQRSASSPVRRKMMLYYTSSSFMVICAFESWVLAFAFPPPFLTTALLSSSFASCPSASPLLRFNSSNRANKSSLSSSGHRYRYCLFR